jgi:hypothetical protein
MTMEELSNVQGRAWEDVDVSVADFLGSDLLLTFDSTEKSTDEGVRKEAIEAEFYIPSYVVIVYSFQDSCH